MNGDETLVARSNSKPEKRRWLHFYEGILGLFFLSLASVFEEENET